MSRFASEVQAVRFLGSCVVCGGCVLVCPTDALVLKDDGIQIELHLNSNLCIGCEACISTCAHDAVQMDWVYEESRIVAASEWVFCQGCGKPFANQREIESMSVRLKQAGFPAQLLEFTALFCVSCKYTYAALSKGY